MDRPDGVKNSLNFDDLLKFYLQKWDCSNPYLIAETPTSQIYKVQCNHQERILKIYTLLGRKFEYTGPIWLQNCQGSAVVDVFEFDDHACLIDFIDGEELLTLIESGRDDEATQIIAQTLNSIHKSPIPSQHPFKTFDQQMEALFNHQEDAPDIIHRAKKFAKERIKDQIEIRLLHGDMHHKNIMHHSQKSWIAFDPQCLVGDRAYDCANTLHNPHQRPDLTEDKTRLLRQAEIMSKEMNIDPQRIIDYAYIHGCLSSCWTKMDNGDYCQLSLNTSALLENYITKISN